MILASTSLIIQFHRSRIQNLPNYRKINLGESLPMVIVFQTIQIQRLSSEIQVLRVRLKQSERQLFNAQNYQVQIRQLTEKCFSYENELGEYREEMEKMNKICQTLYHQNETLKSRLSEMDFSLKQKYESQRQRNLQLQQQTEKWKTRYQATQKSKIKQIQDLRNLMQCQRKSMIDREIREMTVKFINERSGLQNEIRKSREMLENKNIDLSEMKKRCQEYEISLMEMKGYEVHSLELESKISVLSHELVRLNEVLREREDMIQGYKKTEYEMSLKLKQQAEWQQESQQLRNLLQSKGNEIQEWKIRCSRLQEEATRGKEMVHFNLQLQGKMQLSHKQVERLNMMLRQKLQQIEKWKARLQQKQMQNTKLKNIETQIPQYESKISMLRAQNERLSGIVKSRLGQIQQWKRRCVQLEGNQARYSLIQKEKQSLQQRFSKQIKSTQEMRFSSQRLEKQLQTYKKYQQRCRQLQNTTQGLQREIDRLNSTIKSTSTQLSDYRQRFNQLSYKLDTYKTTQSKLHDYQSKLILLTQQIQRLNTLIKTKNQDIDQLQQQKLQLFSKVNHYKNYQIKLSENDLTVSKLNNNIEIVKRDVENWQNKFRSADGRIRELENQLFLSANEKDKLSMTLRVNMNQVEQLKSRYNSLQSDMRQLAELKQVCQEQHNQIVMYLSDINNFEKKNKECEKKLQKKNADLQALITKCTTLQAQTQKLTQQYTRLLKSAQQKQKETLSLLQNLTQYQDYARRISILDAQLNRVEIQNKKLQNQNKQMRLKYADQIQGEMREEQFHLVRVLMAVEIQVLRERLKKREVSVEEMRRSILQPVRRV